MDIKLVGVSVMSNYQKHHKHMEEIKRNFWDYFVDHACCCDNKKCICKASTFQDTVARLRDMTSDDIERRLMQEVLDKGKNW